VVKIFLQEIPEEKVGIFPKNRSGKFFFSQIFSCAFGLIQKHQKIKHREK